MSKIVLLVVGAAWAAVLLPPLLRSRVENRPNSSVVDFRRRLSTLQRTVPARGMSPMRSMARPLAPAPARSGPRSHGGRPAVAPRLAEPARAASVTPIAGARQHRSAVAADPSARLHRPQPAAARRAPAPVRQSSARERMRQRRQNVLFMLVGVTAATAFLAASTRNSMMVYAFVLAAVSLAGFCYKLVQIRRQGDMKAYGESWFRAA